MTLFRRSSAFVLIMIAVVLALVALTSLVPTTGAAPNSKISARVLRETANGNATEALVVLSQQADLSAAGALRTKAAKGQYVVNTLHEIAGRTQAPIISLLEQRGIPYQSFWVVNMIQVTGNRALLNDLAARADVKQIDANPHVRTNLPIPGALDSPEATKTKPEWNVIKVKAPRVWALGFRGEGRVVAGADTGVQWDHPALKGHYRGWDGTKANHDFNWHDATSAHSPTPIDPHGHGTFTVSQMVGDDGHGNQLGVAPGAQWIACRNMDPSGTGSPSTYTECFQFLMAPYPVGKPNLGDPSKAPDSINNSWGCPPSEGCSANTLLQITDNVRAAGIFPAVAAGNSGSSCSSITDPPSLYDSSVTVGATDSLNHIASFSSRGPVTVDGSNRRKPDISAPGVNIRGAVPTNGYASGWSGTSMATPHIAGSIALLWQAKPSLIGNIDASEALLEKKAVHLKTTETCGGTVNKVPNNVFGYGVLNIYQAVIAP